MAITELELTPNRREVDWVLNVAVPDASSGVVLKPALPDYRYGIKRLTISAIEDEKKITLLNGAIPLIGPIELGKYLPLPLDFESPVYCSAGNALILQTEDEFDIYLLITGKTGLPIPSQALNPTPLDAATGIDIGTSLSWESEYQSISYDIYLGTGMNKVLQATKSSPEYKTSQDEATYDPGTLLPGITYYWRIDEILGDDKAKGIVWSFTTVPIV